MLRFCELHDLFLEAPRTELRHLVFRDNFYTPQCMATVGCLCTWREHFRTHTQREFDVAANVTDGARQALDNLCILMVAGNIYT